MHIIMYEDLVTNNVKNVNGLGIPANCLECRIIVIFHVMIAFVPSINNIYNSFIVSSSTKW